MRFKRQGGFMLVRIDRCGFGWVQSGGYVGMGGWFKWVQVGVGELK